MTKYVFTVREDIMVGNGKGSEQLSMLLTKMREYGVIEDYDTVISKVSAEKDDELINLKQKYDAVALRDVSDDEAEIVNKIRDIADKLSSVYKNKYETLRTRVSAAQIQARQKRELAKRQLEEADRAMAGIELDVNTAE